MSSKSLKDPASIPIKVRDGGVVIRMFLSRELGSPLFWRIQRFVGRVIGLVKEPRATSVCFDEANALIGLNVRSVRRFVRLTHPVPQKRVEGLESVEESRIPWP